MSALAWLRKLCSKGQSKNGDTLILPLPDQIKAWRMASRKMVCIIFILLVGISFSTGGVMANSCRGGIGCLNCAAETHPRIPMDADTGNHSCQPDGQNRSCGFEVGHRSDKFDSIAPVTESGTHP